MAPSPADGRRRGDGGFTLIESLVAMSIFLILFAAFGLAMRAAWNGALINRSAQGATAIAVENIERARSLAWEELALSHVDDEAPFVDVAESTLIGAEVGLEADEALVVSAVGIVSPRTVEGRDGIDFTVWLYITEAGAGLRRVFVLVTWQVGNADMSHRASTLVSEVVAR
jgi:prepilin-type N-terminal cleavage/methylation domain-containing protein